MLYDRPSPLRPAHKQQAPSIGPFDVGAGDSLIIIDDIELRSRPEQQDFVDGRKDINIDEQKTKIQNKNTDAEQKKAIIGGTRKIKENKKLFDSFLIDNSIELMEQTSNQSSIIHESSLLRQWPKGRTNSIATSEMVRSSPGTRLHNPTKMRESKHSKNKRSQRKAPEPTDNRNEYEVFRMPPPQARPKAKA